VTARKIAPLNGIYKVLSEDGKPHKGGCGTWPLPNSKPGAWLSVKGEIVPCVNGLHLCRAKHLLAWLGPTVWRAEIAPKTTTVNHRNKVVVRKARLLYKVETWSAQTARLFAADCAEAALRRAKVTDKRCWNAVRVARQIAFGLTDDATWDAARAATWDAARAGTWDAAWAAAKAATWAAARAATWDAARATAWDAARAATWDAARAGTWDAAWAATWDAAWDAAWDATYKHHCTRLFQYLNNEVDIEEIERGVS
jgi:hypothetical protein